MTTWIAALVSLVVAGWAVLRWGTRWGSTEDERAQRMPGDAYLEGGSPSRVSMTRAISIRAPVDEVWPWICQLGRGAGWYSVDRLDNGRKTSAWHVVSWIPEPRLGDATGIGYLRYIDPGRSLAWWLDGGNFLGSRARMVTCFELAAQGARTRVVSRISADASGPTGALALLAFRAVDSIMAVRQLIGLRDRVEYCAKNRDSIKDPETGDRDQYQFYEILYANGGSAGVRGKESGTRWREAAMRDGVLERN
jgi:hypothetical protein